VRVLFVSSEVSPYSKTGGLADVAAALPASLAAMNHDLMVVTPLYSQVDDRRHRLHPVFDDVEIKLGDRAAAFSVWLADDGRTWFIDLPQLYHRASIYTNDPDEHWRFVMLTVAALELCRQRRWAPDIVHANDWETGLLPLYLRAVFTDDLFRAARTVFTIHNLGYQGVFGAGIADDLGLGDQRYLLHQEHLRQGRIGFLEHALMYADALTTVSPTYAWEIQTTEMGMGLDGLLRRRAHDLVGILNGIDTTVWDPRTDHHLPANYSESNLDDKLVNKWALMAESGIEGGAEVPLLGMISRLVSQKGVELLIRPLARLLAEGRVRCVLLGSGERKYEDALQWLADSFPGRAAYRRGYDEQLAHLIEGGADMFLMPSQYEPCGLNQMYSLAYGTVPVVRRTGGLADTVTHYDPATGEGTGFVFQHYNEEGLTWALEEALAVFPDRKAWRRLQLNGMAQDNSWQRRAGEYDELYRRLVGEEPS
jgi:starch synthase